MMVTPGTPFTAKVNVFGVTINKEEWHACHVRLAKLSGGEAVPLMKGGELTRKLIARMFEQKGMLDTPFIYDGAPSGTLYTCVRIA